MNCKLKDCNASRLLCNTPYPYPKPEQGLRHYQTYVITFKHIRIIHFAYNLKPLSFTIILSLTRLITALKHARKRFGTKPMTFETFWKLRKFSSLQGSNARVPHTGTKHTHVIHPCQNRAYILTFTHGQQTRLCAMAVWHNAGLV